MPDKDKTLYKKKSQCERCQSKIKLAVDHILPIAKGGNDCIVNKQTLCTSCNSKKSDTIDCCVKKEMLSSQHYDETLDFTNIAELSTKLEKRVYECRVKLLHNASTDDIKLALKQYATKHNLRHNIERIVKKISVIFSK
jgi:hypothetical protein